MDSNTLVVTLLNDGQKLLNEIPQSIFPITAAFWIKPYDGDNWIYYVVSPAVDTDGISQAYTRLIIQIQHMPAPFWIDPMEVKLLSPNHPIAKDVLEALHDIHEPQTYPMRWRGNKLGNLYVEGAYLYPLPEIIPA